MPFATQVNQGQVVYYVIYFNPHLKFFEHKSPDNQEIRNA